MGNDSEEIICRQCNETFEVEKGECPTCGTEVRNDLPLMAIVAVGLAVTVLAVYAQQFVLTAIVALFTAAIGYLIYEKRNRIERAKERQTNGGSAARATE